MSLKTYHSYQKVFDENLHILHYIYCLTLMSENFYYTENANKIHKTFTENVIFFAWAMLT